LEKGREIAFVDHVKDKEAKKTKENTGLSWAIGED
jgi:hypothetical protein